MLKKPIFKILYYTFIVLIGLSFLFMLMGIGKRNVDNSFDDKSVADWCDNWNVQVDGKGIKNVDLPVKLDCEKNAVVTITKELPDDLGVYNCMMLESMRQELHVYVDGELRSSYTDEGQKIGNSLPSAYLMVPLYSSDAGSEVKIEVITDTYYSGNISDIYIGSETSVLLMLIKANILLIICIGVTAIIGLVSFICYFMYKSTFDDSIQLFHLFLFSLFTTVWCFSQLKIRQVFIKDLSVCESIGHCCFMLIPVAILLISNFFSNYTHPYFHQIGIFIAILSFLGQNIAHTGFGFDYFELQPITQLYTLWILITCVGSCLIETFKGEISGKHLVVIGFSGQLVGVLAEAILTGLGVRYTHLSFYILGSMIFIVAITLNTFFEFRDIQTAKKEAENANKAKSLFLATMSHEIRTPINVVLGMNEMILRESGDEAIHGYADNIADAGKSLLALVNDILDFSKIEAGKMDIVCVDYRLKQVLYDLIMMTRTRIGEKNLKLELDIDESIPAKYYGDEVRVKQILTNLLTNAVKYTESGTITFSARLIKKEAENALLRFSVKDTGMGIRQEDIDLLLSSSFIRVDQRKNRNIEGTGLGIAITRQLLDLMGSSLKVESVYGEGSEFYFELEQHIVDDSPMGAVVHKKEKSETKAKNSFTAKGVNVLAVDDTKTNLIVIKGLLKPYEMTVDMASSGLDCIEKCKDKHYDVILMDHMMPGMDGIDTLKELKKEDLINENTKVLALTANAISGAEEMYLNNGFDGYLTKPIDVVALDKSLRSNISEDKIEVIE